MSEHIDDLMPCLMGQRPPLWEGADNEFAAWAQAAFGIPATIQTIMITPRTNRLAGVAIGGTDGAIVFVLSNDLYRQQLKIDPHRLGPIAADPVIREKAVAAGRGTQIFDAVAALLSGICQQRRRWRC